VDARARLLAALVFLVSVSLVRSIPGLLAHAALPLIALVLSRIRPEEFLRAGFLLALAFSALMEEVANAMTARGFRGEARFLPDARFRSPEWALLATVALFCIAVQFA
jgi:energy-coupling factor transporter transmembrane protein EcfT